MKNLFIVSFVILWGLVGMIMFDIRTLRDNVINLQEDVSAMQTQQEGQQIEDCLSQWEVIRRPSIMPDGSYDNLAVVMYSGNQYVLEVKRCSLVVDR